MANPETRAFLEKVYDIVARIPPGKVATYGQISMLAGRLHGARIVGHAMQNTPMERNLPCHRVVNSSGKLAPQYAFGGSHIQRGMLEREGVTFRPNGTIDVKRNIWDGREA